MNQKSQGFTLIELLVVIAIIALLSSVVLATLSTARAKGRDARRQADMEQIRVALAMFYDAKGRYPSAADGNCGNPTYSGFGPGECLQVLVTGGYLPKLPIDPLGTTANPLYKYDNYCTLPLEANTGVNDQYYRVWTDGETVTNGLQYGWWYTYSIGASNCTKPS